MLEKKRLFGDFRTVMGSMIFVAKEAGAVKREYSSDVPRGIY